jgi:hypothetical protein
MLTSSFERNENNIPSGDNDGTVTDIKPLR